jgi:hypothetical protein
MYPAVSDSKLGEGLHRKLFLHEYRDIPLRAGIGAGMMRKTAKPR